MIYDIIVTKAEAVLCRKRGKIMIKTSINAWSVEYGLGFEDMFRIISSHGYDGIELNLDNPGSAHAITFETSDETLDDIRRYSEKYSLPVVSISSSLYEGMLGDNDPAVREKAKKIVRRQVYVANKLGATGILIVPGGMKEGRSLLASWNNSLTALKELREEMKDCKVKIDVENVWNGFFTSPFDMANFVDEIGTDIYGAYLDLGNMHAFSWSEYWVEILGSRIDKIHVKGYKRRSGINRGGSFVNVTEGDINWEKTMPLLAKTGFDGYITAEVGKDDDNMTWDEFYKITYSQVKSLCDIANK